MHLTDLFTNSTLIHCNNETVLFRVFLVFFGHAILNQILKMYLVYVALEPCREIIVTTKLF